MEKFDPYNNALTHLKHPDYKNIQSIYDELKDREEKHNKNVSEYFGNKFPEILDIIKSKSNIQENYGIRKAIENDELTDQDRIGFEHGFINPTIGLYSEHLFEYLLKRSTIDKALLENDLKIKDVNNETYKTALEAGWVFHILTSNEDFDNNKMIAKWHPAGRNDLQILKEILLSDEFMEITSTLKKFESEVQGIQKLYDRFIYEINRIVHNFTSLGLKGKCFVEKELSPTYTVKSLFHRH